MYMAPFKQVLLSLNTSVAFFFFNLATSSQTQARQENLSK